jgi:hypothetical protein
VLLVSVKKNKGNRKEREEKGKGTRTRLIVIAKLIYVKGKRE